MEQTPMFEDFVAGKETKTMTPKEAIAFQVEKKELPAVKQPTGLQATEDGLIDLSTIQNQIAYATRLMQEGMISESFKTPQQVVLGIQYCKEINIPALVGLKMMYVVNGKPSLYGEGPLSLCLRSGQVEMIREFFIDDKCEEICVKNKNLKAEVYGAVTQLKRVGDKSIQEDHFTLDDLEVAGIDKNKYGQKDVWKKFQRNMMRYKARTMSLRTKFADLIAGMNVAEYHDHFDPTNPEIVVNSKPAIVDEIRKYASEEEANQEQEATQ